MTPIRPTVHEKLDPSLLAEDQVRLRWLREDLTSCLGEVGEILRRVSGDFEAPPAFSIAVDSPTTSSEPKPSAGSTPEEAVASPAPLPPVTITWTRVDGAVFTYDWRTGALHCERPPA